MSNKVIYGYHKMIWLPFNRSFLHKRTKKIKLSNFSKKKGERVNLSNMMLEMNKCFKYKWPKGLNILGLKLCFLKLLSKLIRILKNKVICEAIYKVQIAFIFLNHKSVEVFLKKIIQRKKSYKIITSPNWILRNLLLKKIKVRCIQVRWILR